MRVHILKSRICIALALFLLLKRVELKIPGQNWSDRPSQITVRLDRPSCSWTPGLDEIWSQTLFKIYALNKEFNFYYLISQDAEDIEAETECELFYESEFQKIPLVRDLRTRQTKKRLINTSVPSANPLQRC